MKLLLVEDDRGISSFVVKGLTEAGETVDLVERGDDAISMLYSGSYDAVIMDIMLPGMDGLSVIDEMRANGNTTPVLILSAKKSVDERVEGFSRGGDDYLTKPFAFSELKVRLDALVRRSQGSGSNPAEELKIADLTLNPLSREVKRGDQEIILQPREYALLELLLRNQGTVLTKTIILEKIWNWNFDPQTNVVDVLVSRLRSRIDRDFEPKLIQTIRGAGYVIKTIK